MIFPTSLIVLVAATLSIAAPVSDIQDPAHTLFARADIKPISCGRTCLSAHLLHDLELTVVYSDREPTCMDTAGRRERL